MSSVSRARVGYRKLLKSINVAFKDDTHAVKQAKIQLKNEFLINREVVKSEELQSLFQGIDEVDAMLRFNIVQAGKNNRGNFEVKLSPEHHHTVHENQHESHGAALEVVDQSYIGKPIKVEQIKGSRSVTNEKPTSFDKMDGTGCGRG